MTPPVTRLQGLDPLSPLHRCAARHMPAMHNPDHQAPFDAYVRAMALELEANQHKGDRQAWLAQDPRVLVSEVLYHAAKLVYALRQYQQGDGPAESVVEFAADVGNIAMMVADAAGVLLERPAPTAPPAGERDGGRHIAAVIALVDDGGDGQIAQPVQVRCPECEGWHAHLDHLACPHGCGVRVGELPHA